MKYLLCLSVPLLPFSCSRAHRRSVYSSPKVIWNDKSWVCAAHLEFILPQCYCPGSTLKGFSDSSGATHGPWLHSYYSKPEKTLICGFKSVVSYVTSKCFILIFAHLSPLLPHLKGRKNTATSCKDDDTSMCHNWNAKHIETFLLAHSHCAKYEIICQWGCLLWEDYWVYSENLSSL